MENTGKVLFSDDVLQWYVALGEQWQGPLTAADVYQKVLNQEITWAHFVWKPGQAGWERICDIKTFQVAVPPVPNKTIRQEVKEAAKPVVRPASAGKERTKTKTETKTETLPFVKREVEPVKPWFLHHQDTQYGPFSPEEVTQFIHSGKVSREVYGWRDGMENWERLENIAGFREVFDECSAKLKKKTPPPAPAAARSRTGMRPEMRTAPRRPLVAKILMTQDDQLVTAICRDISIGGLQVLTDRIPGPIGTRVKMNVSAVTKKGSRTKIEPFVAEGVIVRILEDGRGFSFRFEKLTETAKNAIEAYIHATS